mmetsp:Transcript_42304/g.66260  ORF Transcript_42304/g.66260 Transcript_42304/m.66260 type:complete len:127 (+) Transcript_42304:472-852(+)
METRSSRNPRPLTPNPAKTCLPSQRRQFEGNLRCGVFAGGVDAATQRRRIMRIPAIAMKESRSIGTMVPGRPRTLGAGAVKCADGHAALIRRLTGVRGLRWTPYPADLMSLSTSPEFAHASDFSRV